MNTAQFLTRVRELAQLPNVDEDWTDAEILAEATESLLERAIPRPSPTCAPATG